MQTLPSSAPTVVTDNSRLPVAVIGAGPIGLVAAAHLARAGQRSVVFEAGASVGASIREWGHVHLFSPWRYLVDPVAGDLLDEVGWSRPDDETLPTGLTLVEAYLEPLAAHPAIAPHLRLGTKVDAVSRHGLDKVQGQGREAAPFELRFRDAAGQRGSLLARAVIDASGTWTRPNPAGAGGVPAPGEMEHRDRIHYGMPDVLGSAREAFAGRHTLVLGSGHSASHVLLELGELARTAPGTRITWALRRDAPGTLFGGGARDELPARGRLGTRLRALVESGGVTLVSGFRTAGFETDGAALRVVGADGRALEGIDRVVAATGFRPDLDLLREVRVELDPWLEAPVRLAPLVDPNVHSCGTVYPHGYEELRHPEKDLFVVGMKSYGRAPTFLALTGYEQVRSVVAALSGDLESARDVRLVLPETGVCSSPASTGDGPGGGATTAACCG
jgi:hypothetical protein